MRGTHFCIGTCAAFTFKLLHIRGFFILVLPRETPKIRFSATAERRKPSCQASAQPVPPGGCPAAPQPHSAKGCRSPTVTFPRGTARPAARPSPGRPSTGAPPVAAPAPGPAPPPLRTGGPVREWERVQPRRSTARPRSSPAAAQGAVAAAEPPQGGDTRIEGDGPPPQTPAR